MVVYGRWSGAHCRHYPRLAKWHARGKADQPKPGQSYLAQWVGTEGPCQDLPKGKVCSPWSGKYGETEPGEIASNWRILSEDEALSTPLNTKEHGQEVRNYQATLATKHGYHGPIKAGEARSLSHFLKSIGKEEHVKRLWVHKKVERVRYPGTAWERRWKVETLHGPVYAFKPFLDGYTFEDFMRVLRMMRPGCKDARKAIREAMANPTMREDLDMLSAFDSLGAMGGGQVGTA